MPGPVLTKFTSTLLWNHETISVNTSTHLFPLSPQRGRRVRAPVHRLTVPWNSFPTTALARCPHPPSNGHVRRQALVHKLLPFHHLPELPGVHPLPDLQAELPDRRIDLLTGSFPLQQLTHVLHPVPRTLPRSGPAAVKTIQQWHDPQPTPPPSAVI